MDISKFCFLGSRSETAQDAVTRLRERYGHAEPEDADVIVALGGDGFMLHTLHAFMDLNIPVYGMNRGTVGFLMNDYAEDGLPDLLNAARTATINPLRMTTIDHMERRREALAINEVALFRETYQAAKLRITVDGEVRMDEMICDGVLAATPAGSTAYNLSAHGPILPIRSRLIALTPISPFRPRRWRGAILPLESELVFEVHEQGKRPVSATADHHEVRDVSTVKVKADSGIELRLLYNAGHGLEERLMSEQFNA